MFAITFGQNPFDFKVFGDFARFVGNPRCDHPASGFVARRRFDLDELLNSSDNSFLSVLKKIEKFIH